MNVSKYKIVAKNKIFTVYKIPFTDIERANLGVHDGDAAWTLAKFAKEEKWDIAINAAMFSMGKPTDKYYYWNVTNCISKGKRLKYGGNYSLRGIAFGNPFPGIGAYGSDYTNSTGKPVDFIGGAPTLIVKGKAQMDMTGISPASYATYMTQRTAMGITKDSIIFISSLANKTNLPAVTAELLALGCIEAINLDGGGSTSMYVDGKILRKGRNIPTAFGIKLKQVVKPSAPPTEVPKVETKPETVSTGIAKLNVVDGVIQGKSIAGIPFTADIVQSSGKKNVRTEIPMKETLGITIHNTGNIAATATDSTHANWLDSVEKADKQYIGVQFFVDDDSITQTLPMNEVAYHAGDGKGDGNYKTIAIEICENGNILKAEDNAKKLAASLLLTYPNFRIYKHQDWSGKYCPRVILDRGGWTAFVGDIMKYVDGAKTIPETDTTNLIGTTITIVGVKVGAYRTAKDAMARTNSTGDVPAGTYPIMIQHSSGAYNIGKGYLYWVNPEDLYIAQTYTVVKGDTLGKIAAKYKTTVGALITKNNIVDANSIRVGQTLIIK